MPIKFRCKHCRQFLGISREKAGQVVDCPTCGRSVRVPELDGHVAPILPPQLDLKDSQLADALGELAALNEPSNLEMEITIGSDLSEAKTLEPVAISDPIAVEAPPPTEPIDVSENTGVGATSGAKISDSESELAIRQLLDGNDRSLGSGNSANVGWISKLDSVSPQIIAAVLCSLLLLSFLIGYGIGRSGQSAEPDFQHAESREAPNGNGQIDDGTVDDKIACQGRITYKTANGSKQDVGASVILLPESRAGDSKLTILGFRPADPEVDFQKAQTAIRELGGELARVNSEGVFKAKLSSTGAYFIVVISHFQPRDESLPRDVELQSLVSNYFDRPNQLLGKLDNKLGRFRYNGTDSVIWDHSFERSEK